MDIVALAFDASSVKHYAATSTTLSHTCTGTNGVLIIGVGFDDSAQTGVVSAISYGGQAATKLSASTFQLNKKAEIWYVLNPPTGANNIAITTNSSNDQWVSGLSYTGARIRSVIDVSGSTKGTAATATISLTTNFDNTWVVGFETQDVTSTPTAHTGTTKRVSELVGDAFGVFFFGGDTNGPVHPAGSQAIGWDLGSTGNWAIAAAAIMLDTSSGMITPSNNLRPRVFSPGLTR